MAETLTDIERSHQEIDIEDDLEAEVLAVVEVEAEAETEIAAIVIDTLPLDDHIVKEAEMIETMAPEAVAATEEAQCKKTLVRPVVAA